MTSVIIVRQCKLKLELIFLQCLLYLQKFNFKRYLFVYYLHLASPSLANGKIADTPANSPTTPLPAVATIGAIDWAPAVTNPKVFPCLRPFFSFSSSNGAP